MTQEGDGVREGYNSLVENEGDDLRVKELPWKKQYEWPAVKSLLPDVAGKDVLDAGCGTGPYSEWLVAQGAAVTGIDLSENLLEVAKERVGGQATFYQSDLSEPLDRFEADTFDLVVSQQVLDYVRDWKTPFSEFARLLRPEGTVVFSVAHPLHDFRNADAETYYDIERLEQNWGGTTMYDYRRPVSAVLNLPINAGFSIKTVLEPRPQEAYAKHDKEAYRQYSKRPRFLLVKATVET